ncbi:Peroxisome biogenesis protein 2 [Phytophthora nicotianae]|uniref:RING-type E3 ubiquitin transferase (cysteine targeting) n=1 Tax=Phytophthora nicotianae TaxID=4792 RepID=A0A0W8C017_PHYNI|nr:Peroxisome biogenesis protein 2 [Phytophthora nicotianae]
MQPHLQAAAAALQESRGTAFRDSNAVDLRVQYKSLRSPPSNLRVNKWDALILDSEILGLLKAPMKSMFSMFEPGIVDRVKPEIDAVLGAMLFVFTTGVGRPTPGMKLENVRYAPHLLTRHRVGAFFLLSVGVPYVWKRLIRYLSSSRWTARGDRSDGGETSRERMLALMKKLETLVITCQFVNLLIFLRKGTYRSLPERCLGMKMESITPSTAPRSINFEYMTRQLLWEGLMCCLCGISPPQTPYITSCKHVYCYYCLQTAVATEDDFAGRAVSGLDDAIQDSDNLRTLATDATSQLNVLGHDRDTLGVDGAQVRVLEQTHKVSLGGLLQGQDGRTLETQVGLEVLGDFTHQTLERQLADQKLRRLLVTTDLTQSDRTRAVTVRLLDTAGGRGRLTGGLCGELLARGLASGGLAGGLLGTSHCDLEKLC